MTAQKQTKAIGFRVEKDAIYWSVVAGTKNEPILLAYRKMKAPAIYADEEAARLGWFRGQVSDIINEHKPKSAMIRYPETNSPGGVTNSTRERLRLEGVVLQLLYEQRVKTLTGPLVTIASSIKLELKSVKKEMTTEDFRGLDLSKYTGIARESIIAAVAALEE
ncbi:hypothetical protein [Leptolyngbya sp. FACHB-17]|uniref:hypothetical protein n=1 Tax=unclassified Leptolyngbya TaxID=2650499 RepID=UPI0016807943|nr:hypothetical protein [Leptolyngbya sp. FACHB-17]MBD2078324.1 hypothetical protein [Leptolyngbya sp. FACHB-17]